MQVHDAGHARKNLLPVLKQYHLMYHAAADEEQLETVELMQACLYAVGQEAN